MTARRYHAETVRFDAKSPEGYIRGDAPVTKVGVFPYRQADGSILREYRPASEVFKASALKSMENLPIQVDHVSFLDANNMQALKVGQIGEKIRVDHPYVMANLVVDSEKGISSAEAGKNQLSCGYWCDLVMQYGKTDDGQEYDAIQTNIRYNHLALCEMARLGPELQIQIDRADSGENVAIHTPGAMRHDSSEVTMKKVKLSTGIEYDALPEVAVELDSLNAKIAALNTKIAEDAVAAAKVVSDLTAAKDAAEGKAAAEKVKADAAEGKLATLPALIQEGVKTRGKLEADAKNVLGNVDLSAKTDSDIRKEVIKKKAPDLKLDGKSDGFVENAYDVLLAVKGDATEINRQHLAPGYTAEDNGEDELEKAKREQAADPYGRNKK